MLFSSIAHLKGVCVCVKVIRWQRNWGHAKGRRGHMFYWQCPNRGGDFYRGDRFSCPNFVTGIKVQTDQNNSTLSRPPEGNRDMVGINKIEFACNIFGKSNKQKLGWVSTTKLLWNWRVIYFIYSVPHGIVVWFNFFQGSWSQLWRKGSMWTIKRVHVSIQRETL